MKLRLVSLACSALAACSSTQGEPHPQGAKTVTQSRCSFSFLAPADTVPVEIEGIDSCIDEFRGKECTYYAGYGWYADPLEPEDGKHDYEAHEVSVDGAPAKLVRFRMDGWDRPYFIGILMENVDPESPETSLSFHAWCRTAGAREAADEVVRSVMRDD